MSFSKIDVNNWDRKHYYDFFINVSNGRFAINANIDITELLKYIKAKKLRVYPTISYMTSRVINENEVFKISVNEQGEVGVWDFLNVRYPLFNEKSKKFSDIWTGYSYDFKKFYNDFLKDIEKYGKIHGMKAKPNVPPNFYHISSVPWVSFTGINMHTYQNGVYLLPICVFGKFFEQEGKTLLPVCFEIHHAICDGYDASKFFIDLQKLADSFEDWA